MDYCLFFKSNAALQKIAGYFLPFSFSRNCRRGNLLTVSIVRWNHVCNLVAYFFLVKKRSIDAHTCRTSLFCLHKSLQTVQSATARSVSNNDWEQCLVHIYFTIQRLLFLEKVCRAGEKVATQTFINVHNRSPFVVSHSNNLNEQLIKDCIIGLLVYYISYWNKSRGIYHNLPSIK